ncbi:MAG: hypothetical protein IPH36_19710 [Saprospiraceae bacterium]|nr:hypothetical protein [Saprospiraceae bacterium]
MDRLHNAGSNDVNIGGWCLSDKENKPKKMGHTLQVPSSRQRGYLLFWASGRDVAVDSNFHTNFRIYPEQWRWFVILANAAICS